MKKLGSLLLVFVMLFAFTSTAFAAESFADGSEVKTPLGGFEIISEEITREINSKLASQAGDMSFAITKQFATSDSSMGNEITIEVTRIEKTPASAKAPASGTVNFALSGRYYFTSNNVTVSNYGIHGSVDYTGSSLKNIIWDKYHDVTVGYSSLYSATSSKSTEDVTNGKTLIGNFRLKNTSTNKWCDDAKISITVKFDGNWSTVGNYSAININ